MDVTAISQLITSVGFPIAACCVMFYQNGKLQKTLQDVTVTMQEIVLKIENVEKKQDFLNMKGENKDGNN